jgi:hypothetical protein
MQERAMRRESRQIDVWHNQDYGGRERLLEMKFRYGSIGPVGGWVAPMGIRIW